MRLTEGSRAPGFMLPDLDDMPVSLERYQGRYVLLTFYRFATCPFCNLRVREVAHATDQLVARGIYPVGVFHSSARAMRKQLSGDPLPFPILADPEMALYREYGVERSWMGVLRGMLRVGTVVRAALRGHLPIPTDRRVNSMPADFLIGPDGMVVHAFYGRDVGDHVPLASVLAMAPVESA